MSDNQVVKSIQDKYDSLLPYLNEKTRRIWAAIEARSLGWGGITQNWHGSPLTSLQVVINLIRNTTTTQGLEVSERLDKNQDKTGRKVTDQELDAIVIERNSCHGEWNYIVKPIIFA